MAYVVNPWEASGDIDYEKLIKDFGVEPIDDELLARFQKLCENKGVPLHPMLRRGMFFAHRDLGWFLDQYDAGKPVFLYTGRAPSGPVHIGHAYVWWFTKWLQDLLDIELWFQFPDEEKFLFKQDLTWEESQRTLEDNMLDVAAIGFDPAKTHFIVDTRHADLLYPEAVKVAKRITFSTVKASFGLGNDANIGSIFYTAMQAVPAFLPSVLREQEMACLIPHAADQDPHFRVTRDVVGKLGHHKPASIQCRFLPGLKGLAADGKMSSSRDVSAIFMTDDAKTVKKKVNKYAFSGGRETVEDHREHGGDPDVDIAYQWLTFFEEDDQELKRLHDGYRSGDILSGEMKAQLIDTLNSMLSEHQTRRAAVDVETFLYKR